MRIYKWFFIFFCFFFTSLNLFSTDMPQMPQMPSVTQPTLGEPFYKPTGTTHSKTNDDSKNQTQIQNQKNNKNETLITDGTTTEDLFSSILGLGGNSNLLTANDISTLYDTGMFDNISNLTGSLNSKNNVSSNNLLRQMLVNLEDLKTKQKNSTEAQKEAYKTYQEDSQNFRKRDPLVLRFKINGYNIADSLTECFFSEPELDGSFLLTADRKYYANQKSRAETFYILFKATGSNGSSTFYEVEPSIAQDSKNTNSYIYKFCQQKNLTAEKTGNLVVLHCARDGFNADILLDIDK